MRRLLYVFAVLILLFVLTSCPRTRSEDRPTVLVFDGQSTELSRTEIVPAFESPLPEGRNVIWCATLAMAWNMLAEDVIGETIVMPDAGEAAELLNNTRVGEEVIDPETYYATAGMATGELIEQIGSEMADRFPEVTLPAMQPSESFLIYSYLAVIMNFPNPYEVLEYGMRFTDSAGSRTYVNGFGIGPDDEGADADDIRAQIGVLFYYHDEEDPESVDEFAVDLWVDSSPYQIVLACFERRESMAATFDHVMELAGEFPEGEEYRSFHDDDTLKAPDLWWKISHHYEEIENRPLHNESFAGHFIADALQNIEFKLDRKGVILRVETVFLGAGSAGPVPTARDFIFNRPYLIYLKKRDADHPVFAMWIDNTELLAEADY